MHKEFIFEDTVITDASLDETGRFIVNPVEYYGDAYLNACKQIIKEISK